MKKNLTILELEAYHAGYTMHLLICATLLGVGTHLIPGSGYWQQWAYLGHSFAGIGLSIALIPYSYYHIKRTLGSRRFFVLVTGLLLLFLLIILALSGMHTIIFGQTETTRWIYNSHIKIAYATITLITLHILTHVFSKNKTHSNRQQTYFQTLNSNKVKISGLSMIAVLATIFLLTLLYYFISINTYQPAFIENYQLPYGDNPFAPSETQTYDNNFIDVDEIANSNKCGTCHTDIYNEWLESIHSQAASDITYVRNINLLVNKKGIAAARYCEGCHAPVALLTGELTEHGTHGGMKNTPAHNEGVGCMGCHGISEIAHLKGNASFVFKPANGYLFANTNNIIARKIHNFLVLIHPQEHRIEMAQPILKSPHLCASCHAQFMDKDVNNFGWVKMQDDYSSWLKSSFSGQAKHSFSQSVSSKCHDCHMPLVKSNDPSSNKLSQTKSHRTLGGNTAIPYLNNDIKQFELSKAFLQADKIRIHIEEPWRDDATHSTIYIDEPIRAKSEKPYYYYLGEKAKIKVTVSNNGVGHDFPGGTIDINQAWVSLRVIDASNNTLYSSGEIDDDSVLDPSSHIYQSIPIDKNGQHVWRHDLFRMTGESYRNTIPSGGSDTLEYYFPIPFWTKSPLTITAAVHYRKFNNRYARWALQDNYRELPIIDMAESTLTVPILHKPPATQTHPKDIKE